MKPTHSKSKAAGKQCFCLPALTSKMPGALEPRNCINYPGIQMTPIGTSDWARASQINASLKDGSCNVCKSQEALRASDTFHFKHSDRHEGMKSDYITSAYGFWNCRICDLTCWKSWMQRRRKQTQQLARAKTFIVGQVSNRLMEKSEGQGTDRSNSSYPYQTMTLPLNTWKRAKVQSDNQKKTEVM